MSRERYVEDCVGCRPVAIDLQTGEPCGRDHPLQVALMKVWQGLGPLHRSAFHRVTCLNSRSTVDLALAREYMRRVELASKATVASAPVEMPSCPRPDSPKTSH